MTDNTDALVILRHLDAHPKDWHTPESVSNAVNIPEVIVSEVLEDLIRHQMVFTRYEVRSNVNAEEE